MFRRPLALMGVVAVVTAICGAANLRAKSHLQHVFVTVRDQAGLPVHSLKVSDFQVTESGKRREVTHAALATDLHSRIAILLDNGFLAGSNITPIRRALEALVKGVPAEDDMVLGTISPQFRLTLKPTADRSVLLQSINMLFAGTASGTAMVDGLIEMDNRFLKPVPDRWPVFVVITTDSPEVSGRQLEEYNSRILEWVRRGARAYVLVIAYSTKARGNEQELGMPLARNTGGTYETLNTITSLPDKLQRIADAIVSGRTRAADEYLVEFDRESDGSSIGVTVPVPGLTVGVSLTP